MHPLYTKRAINNQKRRINSDIILTNREMTKRKMTENEQSEMEEENAEMKSKIIKLQDSLLEKTEECCELKIKMKEMEVKIEKLEETVKGIKEKPATSLDVKPSRILSSKDREAVYAMIEGWSFHGEIERMNYNVLRWIDKTVGIFRLKHLRILDTAVSPKKFMEYMADGFMLYRLAQILNEEQQHTQVMERKKRYEYFYNFAKEKAQLADGCIFLYDELFDQSYDNYKSVFSTFYILAEQAREKFNKKTLQEIEHEDYQEKFMHGQNAFFANHNQQSKMRNSNFQF